MNHATKHSITIGNKRYEYILQKIDEKATHVICPAANIDQNFLHEDISDLLQDIPHLILAEKEYVQKYESVIRFRVTIEDKKKIEKKALEKGYRNVSSFIRDIVLKK